MESLKVTLATFFSLGVASVLYSATKESVSAALSPITRNVDSLSWVSILALRVSELALFQHQAFNYRQVVIWTWLTRTPYFVTLFLFFLVPYSTLGRLLFIETTSLVIGALAINETGPRQRMQHYFRHIDRRPRVHVILTTLVSVLFFSLPIYIGLGQFGARVLARHSHALPMVYKLPSFPFVAILLVPAAYAVQDFVRTQGLLQGLWIVAPGTFLCATVAFYNGLKDADVLGAIALGAAWGLGPVTAAMAIFYAS